MKYTRSNLMFFHALILSLCIIISSAPFASAVLDRQQLSVAALTKALTATTTVSKMLVKMSKEESVGANKNEAGAIKGCISDFEHAIDDINVATSIMKTKLANEATIYAVKEEAKAYTESAISYERSCLKKLASFQGPEIRTGFLKDGKPVQLKQGEEITISTDYDLKGDEKVISMSYKKLAQDVKPGSVILCSDGTISFTVLSCDTERGLVRVRCENSALLGERKNVNLPGVVVDLPTLTEKDKEDILGWGVPNKIDIIALSFVRKGSDLAIVRGVLGEHAKNIILMSKVENQEGVQNFDEILANSDAFMVARGDLGMEIPIEKIFLAQKTMIHQCNLQGKPVVTATQMLESMIKSPRPTRAEATDVANAVLDGTDCVMLSGETAAGAYPEEAVKTMARTCMEAENTIDYGELFAKITRTAPTPMSPLESLASSAVQNAYTSRAALIIVLTRGGTTAKLVAKYRPSMPILSVVVPDIKTDGLEWSCSEETPARHSLVYRGLVPALSAASARGSHAESTDGALAFAMQHAKDKGLCKVGDTIVAVYRIGADSSITISTVN